MDGFRRHRSTYKPDSAGPDIVTTMMRESEERSRKQLALYDRGLDDAGLSPPSARNTANIDIICNPLRKKNITLHLSLGVQEDLDMVLEQLARFSRLGDFRNARVLFERELTGHLGKPHVLVQWAETLLNQGDYISMAELDSSPMRALEETAVNGDDARLLTTYWKLMHLMARYRRLELDNSSEDWEVLTDVLENIRDDINMTSTEVCFCPSRLATFSG